MYILKCFNDLYYTGSTNNLEKRLSEHQSGNGANFTKKNLPVELVYYEEYQRIDEAFYREKQVQGWSRKKKDALINGKNNELPELALAYRDIKNIRTGGFEHFESLSAQNHRSSSVTEALEDTVEKTFKENHNVK